MCLCEDPSTLVSYLFEWNNLSKSAWIYCWWLQCAFAIIVLLFPQDTGSHQCPVETGEPTWHWVIDDWPVAKVNQFSNQQSSLLYSSYINCCLGWIEKCHSMKWICLVWLQLKERTEMKCFQTSTIQVIKAIEQELTKHQDLEVKVQSEDNQIFSW